MSNNVYETPLKAPRIEDGSRPEVTVVVPHHRW
jgi:hypothetical protein